MLRKPFFLCVKKTVNNYLRGVPKVLHVFDLYTREFYKKKLQKTRVFSLFLPFPHVQVRSYLNFLTEVYFCISAYTRGFCLTFFQKKRWHFIFGRHRAKNRRKKTEKKTEKTPEKNRKTREKTENPRKKRKKNKKCPLFLNFFLFFFSVFCSVPPKNKIYRFFEKKC